MWAAKAGCDLYLGTNSLHIIDSTETVKYMTIREGCDHTAADLVLDICLEMSDEPRSKNHNTKLKSEKAT